MLVRSTINTAVLPHNVKVGTIRPQTSDDEVRLVESAETTANQLADTWFEYASSAPSAPVCAISKTQPTGTPLHNWKVSDQLAEMQQSGLDSSILSSFLPEPDIDHPNMFSPTSTLHLDPHSEEYYQKLVEALELDTQAYSHVSPEILTQFKALICKYPMAFHSPEAELLPGIDFVGELPMSPSGNRWILTAVCPYSNYLRAIPVPDKTATTAAYALVNDVFLSTGFQSDLQSGRGREWLNALLHRITKLLSIKHVFTSGFWPRLNGATERTHHFLNTALGIVCEKQQERWEQFLQPAVYTHNVSPISGTSNITPFFLDFGRHATSPETISLQLPVHPLPPDYYAKHLIARLQSVHKDFTAIKADLRRKEKDLYDQKARFLSIPDGKVVYVRKEPPSHLSVLATRFIKHFDGPYLVTGHLYERTDLLTLKHIPSGETLPHPINIEKVAVIPAQDSQDLRPPTDAVIEIEDEPPENPVKALPPVNSELRQVAYEFGKYLNSLPTKTATASQACKLVHGAYLLAREILNRHGKLRGLVKSCPYLSMQGASHGGTYPLSLNQDLFTSVMTS